MWGAVIGAGLGALQNLEAVDNYKQQLGYETEAKISSMKASSESYSADVDAIMVQNYINENYAAEAIAEASRAGAANQREAALQVDQAASTISAQSEGITGGASQARQLSSFYTQASKKMGAMEDQTTSQIINIAENLNKSKNDLAVQERNSYNQMLMSIAGVSSYSSLQAPSATSMASSVMSGVNTGMSFKKNIDILKAKNTPE